MLETEIVKLREAIEALTATLGNASVSQSVNEISLDDKPVEKQEDTTSEHAPSENSSDAVSEQDVKDATLKASRAGHKDAIREKLTALGVSKIQELKGDKIAVFYGWVKGLDQ